MRLIEANALKESVRAKFKALLDRCEINALINSAPTIDAIPVEWLRERKHWAAIDGDYWAENIIEYLLDRWQKEQEAR